jgi:hypothetical protein
MNVPEIKPIQLTSEEVELERQMMDDFENKRPYSGQYAKKLLESLRNRNAIPQARIDYFTKPYPGGRGKSHLDVFKANDRFGNSVAEHANFVEYLRYFIGGPSVPSSTIEGFRKIMIDDAGTSGEVMDQLCKFVRAETRKLRLNRSTAKDEFWKLAKEAGYGQAETIREAAGSAGKK